MAPAFSFKKPLNTITPQRGMVVSVYVSDKDIGSGSKPFLVLAVTGRYVTMLHIPLLKCLRIRRAAWPGYAARVLQVPAIQLFEELTTVAKRHTLQGKRWSANVVGRAFKVIEEWLP